MQNLFLFNSTKNGTLLLPVLHGGIEIKAGGAFFKKNLVVGSFTADNLLQPTGWKQYTSHVTFSPSQNALCDTTLARVFVRFISSMCHAPEWLSVLSSTLTLLSFASLSLCLPLLLPEP